MERKAERDSAEQLAKYFDEIKELTKYRVLKSYTYTIVGCLAATGSGMLLGEFLGTSEIGMGLLFGAVEFLYFTPDTEKIYKDTVDKIKKKYELG